MKAILVIVVLMVIVRRPDVRREVRQRAQRSGRSSAKPSHGAWSQVDVALQRRADLIPNLVETVKGFAKHETEVFTAIANARAALAGARTPQEKIAANDQLDSALAACWWSSRIIRS